MNKKTSKSSCIESLCVDGVIESDPKKLVNCLNVFFANVALHLAADIQPTDRPPDNENDSSTVPLTKLHH